MYNEISRIKGDYMAIVLSEHDFLSPEECLQAKNRIHELEKLWINRAAGFLPFFTLGTASYMDCSGKDDSVYRKYAQQYNPLLKEHFSFVYDRLLEVLSKLIDVPIVYEEELGIPGFHIFLGCKTFEQPIASTHFDLQYKSINWKYKDIDYDHPISFTCPVSLPKTGSGLNYWDITRADVKDLSEEDFNKVRESKEKLFFPYHLGKLVLHNGLILHQIAPSKDLTSEDERITLQGHGLICDGSMRLYW